MAQQSLIQRDQYLKRIRPVIGKDIVKVLTGIRRSGKSVMLELIKEQLVTQGVDPTQFVTYNFESLSTSQLRSAATLYQELSQRIAAIDGTAYLFLDEIQEVTDWETCINSCRVDFDCDIFITGSNAKLLSGELATYLAGRYVEFEIFPFSFSEFLQARGVSKSDTTGVAQEFAAYLELGGMPFLSNLPGQTANDRESAMQYLRDIYNSVLLKDVVQRSNIRNVDLLERIIAYVMANIGHTFSATSIAKYFKSEGRKVAPETILNYLSFCCDAFLFYRLRREDTQTKKLLAINEKYYLVDHGIRQAIFSSNLRDINQTLENIVCLELLRRGYTATVGKVRNKEVDFIAEKQEQKLYIQVAYLLATESTIEREFRALTLIPDNHPKLVLSLDEFDLSRDGITHRNIRDFLLHE